MNQGMPFVPIVAVEMPAEIAPALATAALGACNLALGSGRCALFDEASGGQGNAWTAAIRLDPSDPNRLRIELRDATPQSTLTSFTRDLVFEGPEPLPHRWSTAGVVVAALVISAESSSKPTPEPPTPSPSDVTAGNRPKTNPAPETSKPPTHRALAPEVPPKKPRGRDFRLDFAGFTGPGVEAGELLVGGLLRPSLELGSSVVAWTRASIAAADGTVRFLGWSGAVGLGFESSTEDRRFGLEGRLGFAAERVSLSAANATTEDTEAKSRYGGVVGLDLTLGISRPLALWLGGEVTAMLPRLDVNVGGVRQGELERLGGSLALGVRTRFGFDSK